MSALDDYRFKVLKDLANLGSTKKAWPSYQSEITNFLGISPTAGQVFNLGGHLAEVFQANTRSRSQSDLSSGGAAWETLVCWYLNLIFFDSNAVVIKPKKKYLPSAFADSLSVKVKGVRTNKETDLLAFSVPLSEGNVPLDTEGIDSIVRALPQRTDLTVIQCKTNWNDNAQIPMLWDMIYSAQSIRIPNITVGANGFTPNSFRNFSYAFATVPTVKTSFEPTTTAVVRVRGLSGGNYWGKPSKPNVSDALSEFFGNNFSNSFPNSVQAHVNSMLTNHPNILPKFIDFNF